MFSCWVKIVYPRYFPDLAWLLHAVCEVFCAEIYEINFQLLWPPDLTWNMVISIYPNAFDWFKQNLTVCCLFDWITEEWPAQREEILIVYIHVWMGSPDKWYRYWAQEWIHLFEVTNATNVFFLKEQKVVSIYYK